MARLQLLTILGLLGLISVVILASVQPNLASKQLAIVLISLVTFWLAGTVQFYWWLRWRWPLWIVSLILLALPFMLGHESRNAARWIVLGPIFIQSSQLALPLIALSIAWLASRVPFGWRQAGEILILVTLPTAVIFISPDLGSSLIFSVAQLSVFWFRGTSLKIIGSLAVVALVLGFLLWQFGVQGYQRERLTSFISGAQGTSATHYNTAQAVIAVGHGGFWGQGWGRGSQAHERFLPERHTDFIFASYAEEFGFVGSLVLMVLYGWLLTVIFSQARHASTFAQRLYAAIASTAIALQVIINMGMNVGLLPITGITLPFVSYGGSSFISLALLLGITISHQTSATPSAGVISK